MCLTTPNTWTSTFGSDSKDEDSRRVSLRSINSRWHFTLENSLGDYVATSVINYNVVFFSLKSQGNIGTYYNTTTGAITWTSGATHTLFGQRVRLNPQMFNVHKQLSFTLGNNQAGLNTSTADAQSYGIRKIVYFKKYYPKGGLLINNPVGNWGALPALPEPTKNIFIVIFSDGVYTTTQPSMIYDCQYNLKSLGQ